MKKTLLGTLGIVLASTLGMSPGVTVSADGQSNVKTAQTQNEKQLPKPLNTAKQIVRESAGGFNVLQIGGSGYSPQYYGEYIVKRGTHKRTNKK